MFDPTFGTGRATRIVLLALVAGTMALSVQAFRSRPLAASETTPLTTCDLKHPIDAKLVPLDPIARGSLVRVALDVTSSVPVSGLEARIQSTGGARLVGKRRAELGTLDAGDARRTEFDIELPAAGKRFLLQVLVTAEAATGPMNRLVVLNILPDGPADPGQVVTTPTGESIRQYANSARRIER
ncbi:MAG TPA: hypothetical protein VF720_06385 [Candidatus Eisenbacteria bacterium]